MDSKTKQEELEHLLYQEAELLDSRSFEQWLSLYTEDAVYWIPNLREDSNPAEDGIIIHEKKHELKARVARLQHPAAFTQEPPPRTRHLITNVRITETGDNEALVKSNFVVYAARGSRQTQLAGSCEHVLSQLDGQWRIRRKKMFLINNDQPIDTLPIL